MTLLSILLAAATLQEAPLPREAHNFDDWVVACDNGRRCQAVSLIPEGAAENYSGVVAIEREPGPDAPLALRISQVEAAPARLMVYDETVSARFTTVDGDYRVELEDTRRFLDNGLYGDRIVAQDSAGTTVGQVSLKGLSGALLYMDEVQGRLHTPSALVRVGRRTDIRLPVPPPVPTVRLAPATREAALAIPAARIARLRRETGCDIDDVGGPDEASTAALGDGRTLVLLACGSGAYNVTMVPFLATRNGREIRIEPAPFDVPLEEWEQNEGRRILVNGVWEPEARRLLDFSKGRGLGDCGSRSTYGWDGARFRLLHREEMPECRGSYIYLTTWRAEVVG